MKRYIGLILVVLFGFCFALPVNAATRNGFYADSDVKLNKDIDATAFVAGNNVKVDSHINGIAFIAGNDVDLGSSQDYLFAAGNNVRLNGVSAKDIFAAGSSVTIDNSAARDVYAAASTIKVNSNIAGNAQFGADEVTIAGMIEGNVKVSSEKINIEEGTVIVGTLSYPENAKIKIDDTASIGKQKTYKPVTVEGKEVTPAEKALDVFMSFVKRACAMLVIALILYAVNREFFKGIDEEKKSVDVFFKRFGIGLCTLIVTPIVGLILLISSIGAPLGLIGMLLYVILIYLSIIPTAYYVGKWIFKDNIENEYLLILISIVGLYVIRLIPVIGGFVTFFSICLGLGLFVSISYEKAKCGRKEVEEKPAKVEAEVVEEKPVKKTTTTKKTTTKKSTTKKTTKK